MRLFGRHHLPVVQTSWYLPDFVPIMIVRGKIMSSKHLLRYCLMFSLCFVPLLTMGQEVSPGKSVSPLAGERQTQIPRLPVGADEIAKEIGVMSLIERLYQLP